jgi:hypothetical protein
MFQKQNLIRMNKQQIHSVESLRTQGNITPLHFDLWHGLLVQIVGRKHVIMFDPDDYNNLYPHSCNSLISCVSFNDTMTSLIVILTYFVD